MFFTLKRCFMSLSDNLQSKSVKKFRFRSPENPIGLTETTLKTSRVRWARKDHARGGPAFLIKNPKNPFQGGKQVEETFCECF